MIADHALGDHPLIDAVAPIAEALGAEILAISQTQPGDIPLRWEGETVAVLRLAGLEGALGHMIASIELELGGPLDELSRELKQRAVGILDSRGAFRMRKAIDDVADRMRVSRITVYNYLNAVNKT